MIWILAISLAAIGLLIGLFVLGLPRRAVTILAVALLLGLAGYALQGAPEMASSPREATLPDRASGEAMIELRRSFFNSTLPPSRNVTIADGFARRGQWENAAGFLNNAVAQNPNDTEAWVALGMALVEHSEGVLTQPAIFAFNQGARTGSDNPAPAYLLGIAMARNGRFAETRELWARALENAAPGSQFEQALTIQITQLDRLIERTGATQ